MCLPVPASLSHPTTSPHNLVFGYVHMYLCGSLCLHVCFKYLRHAKFFSSCYFILPFPSHPLSLCSPFTATQNILFLSMAEFRADKGVEGSGGSDIMSFSCQIGSKSSLWAHRRAERGSRFHPEFYRGNDWGPSRPHQQPVIHWLLWYWPTAQVVTVEEMEANCACFII